MGPQTALRRHSAPMLAACGAGLAALLFSTASWAAPRTVAQQGAGANGDPIESAEHYKRARQFYEAGDYSHAIAELEAAIAKDPNEKVLVYNLAIVHEKRGDIDEALKFFRRYQTMDLTDEERKKNEVDLHRLEGAKKDLDAKRAEAEAERARAAAVPVVPAGNGRLDVWTLGAAGVAVASLGVAVFFSVRANADKPPAGFVTGRDGSYADLQNDVTKAHHEAIAADVFYGVGIVGAAGAVLLYALRSKESQSPQPPPTPTVSIAPIRGGAGMAISGAF